MIRLKPFFLDGRFLIGVCWLAIVCICIRINTWKPVAKHVTEEEERMGPGAGPDVRLTYSIGCTCNKTEVDPENHTNAYCSLPSLEELSAAYDINISSTDLQTLERAVFGYKLETTKSYVNDVSKALMMTSQKDKLTPYYKNHTEFRKTYERSIRLRNYTYLAGGRFKPTFCKPKWKVAIVIPFRNREEHLPILVRNLLRMLMIQGLEFGFYVSEQANDGLFNRGLIKNIGYLEATKFADWDCVIFHDIDQVPMRATNYYGCDNMPRHLCAYSEEMDYNLLYPELFGGAVGLTAQQMRDTNGYSNVYWGWGAEDDDIRFRLRAAKHQLYRSWIGGYYRTLSHKKKSKDQMCPDRYCILKNYKQRIPWDGINNMNYTSKVTLNLLYTHIATDVKKEKWNMFTANCEKK